MNNLIKDRYKIISTLGESRNATTFLSVDINTEKKYVIKKLTLKTAQNWKNIELFEREAKTLSNLSHPGIPNLIDFFSSETNDDKIFHLIYEYIDGKSLFELVKEGKQFTEDEVKNIAIEIVRILDYIHKFSPPIIHRDIKPGNIIISTYGTVHLIDFGAVRDKVISEDELASTIIGTFGYMPPEQYEGNAVFATDIYSLGVSLIFALSKKEPSKIEKNKLKLLFESHVNISDNFTKIIDKMIEPDHKERFQSAEELFDALRSPCYNPKGKSTRGKFILSTAILLLLTLLPLLLYFNVEKKYHETTYTLPIKIKQYDVTNPSILLNEKSGSSILGNTLNNKQGKYRIYTSIPTIPGKETFDIKSAVLELYFFKSEKAEELKYSVYPIFSTHVLKYLRDPGEYQKPFDTKKIDSNTKKGFIGWNITSKLKELQSDSAASKVIAFLCNNEENIKSCISFRNQLSNKIFQRPRIILKGKILDQFKWGNYMDKTRKIIRESHTLYFNGKF